MIIRSLAQLLNQVRCCINNKNWKAGFYKSAIQKIFFQFHEFLSSENLPVVILEIQAATNTPVQFDGTEFIRIGSYKKKLRDFPERERALWRVFDKTPFEKQAAAENCRDEDVLHNLDYPQYFELTNQPFPEEEMQF